jgi:hypothetical protein
LATPNYAFEKRQRDLAKKAKKTEKLKRKQGEPDPDNQTDTDGAPDAVPGSAPVVPAKT